MLELVNAHRWIPGLKSDKIEKQTRDEGSLCWKTLRTNHGLAMEPPEIVFSDKLRFEFAGGAFQEFF